MTSRWRNGRAPRRAPRIPPATKITPTFVTSPVSASTTMPTAASWSASVTCLVKTIIGAGILGLPYAFAQTGYLLGISLLLLCGAAQWFALHLLAILVLDAKSRGVVAPSFRSLALDAFGSNVGATAFEIVLGIHCFGTSTSYLIVVGDLMPQLVGLVSDAEWLNDRHLWIAIVAIFIELPLFWQRTLDALKISSHMGNLAVALVAMLTISFAIGILHPDAPPTSFVPFLPPTDGNSSTQVGVLGVYVFAYACAMNLPAITIELNKPTIKRIDSVALCGVGLSALLYVLVGWGGAAAFGDSVAPNLLISFPIDVNAAGRWSVLSGVVARALMTLNVAATFPLMMFPARNAVSLIHLGRPAASLDRIGWAVLTLGLFVPSLMLAMMVSSLDLALGLVGGSTGMCIGFIFPGLLYANIMRGRGADAATADAELRAEEEAEEGENGHSPYHNGGSATPYRRLGAGETASNAVYCGDFCRVMGAKALVVGGVLLVPVLVGVQVMKAVST